MTLLLVQEIPLILPQQDTTINCSSESDLKGFTANKSPVLQIRGRLDHMFYDAGTKTMYVCCLGADMVLIVDVFAGVVRSCIGGVHMPQGVLYHAASQSLFISCAGGELWACHRTGAKSHTVGHSSPELLPGVKDAENIRALPGNVESSSSCVVVGAGEDPGALIRLTVSNKLACDSRIKLGSSLQLPAHPEGLSVSHSFVYVNVADDRSVWRIPISRVQQRVERVGDDDGRSPDSDFRVELPQQFSHNFPLVAIDDQHVIVGVRKPPRLLLFRFSDAIESAKDAELLDTVPIPADVDDLCWDARRHQVYVPGGAGYVVAVKVRLHAAPHMSVGKSSTSTAVGARTALFVPSRDRLYVAAPATAALGPRLLVLDPANLPIEE